MPRLPSQGDNHGNLLAKIVENTFAGVMGGGVGPAGPQGPAGADGAQGPQGTSGDLTPGIESLADTTAIWLTAAEFVGIGTPDPEARLHIFSSSVGAVTPSVFADELVLENNDHCGFTIFTPNDRVAVIYFGDPDDNDIGQISYNHSVDTLTLTAGTVNVVNCIATACNPGSNNTISLGNGGNRWTEVFATNGTINTSDAREKNSISDISLVFATNLVDAITPRSYVWNDPYFSGTHYGFVAQEIEAALVVLEMIPSEFSPLYYDQESDTYGLRAGELLPILWRVVQDQQSRIETLENA